MKTLTRIILTFLSFFASSLFIYWVPFSFIPLPGADKILDIPLILSLLIALTIGFFVWKQTGKISNGLFTHIIMGGIITGSIGFITGFIGPMIFSPSSNQGPLLGLFITGPIGFLIGLIGGGIFWRIKVKNKMN